MLRLTVTDEQGEYLLEALSSSAKRNRHNSDNPDFSEVSRRHFSERSIFFTALFNEISLQVQK